MIPLNDYLRKVLITEQNTTGFTLTLADHEALKDRETLRFSNGAGDKITVRLLADSPDYVPDPIPPFPANVDHSNPFGMVGLGNQLYVADGGRNLVFQVDTGQARFLSWRHLHRYQIR